jgi:hypothetical protein
MLRRPVHTEGVSMTIKIIAAALVLLTTPAMAAGQTVRELNRQCGQPGLNLFCTGYVTGVAHMMFMNAAEPSEVRACLGERTVSNGAVVQAFTNWTAKHPEHWEMESITGVMLAIRATWPCR